MTINTIIKEIVKNYASAIKEDAQINSKNLLYWITPGNNEGYYLEISDQSRGPGMSIRYHCNIDIIAEDIKKIEDAVKNN